MNLNFTGDSQSTPPYWITLVPGLFSNSLLSVDFLPSEHRSWEVEFDLNPTVASQCAVENYSKMFQ